MSEKFPYYGVEIDLNGKPWCVQIYTNQAFAESIAEHSRSRTSRVRVISNQEELERAEFQVDKYEDWSSDVEVY